MGGPLWADGILLFGRRSDGARMCFLRRVRSRQWLDLKVANPGD